MATAESVRRALRSIGAAVDKRFFTTEDEGTALATFHGQLERYTDRAVDLAANEWISTGTSFPKLVEFVALVRKHQGEIDERLMIGGPAPRESYPVGRPGEEKVAASIVLQRMLDAVAREAPLGYLGRARGLRGWDTRVASAEELGHTHMDGGECARCQALATIAFEQVVDFQDSTVTWDAWEKPPGGMEGLRRCANASCDHGWVEKAELDGTVRLVKCETCGGPQPAKVRPKVMDGEEMITVQRRRRRK